jgi:SMODS-associating 4TM effector domain
MSDIRAAQNEEESLGRRRAARYFYKRASWIYFGGALFTVALALMSPVVLFASPGLGPTLGAIAGAWIFVSRLLLEPLRQEYQLKGATAQEHFDCAVLGMEWNDALVRRLPDEEISGASRDMENADQERDWYPADADIAWPNSVLTCQRSNAVWARRQHHAYARAVALAAAGWWVVGVIVAVTASATLSEYLVIVLLPSLPAFLDAYEISRRHSAAAMSRRLVEDQADNLLADGTATEQSLRELQDQVFNLRRVAPPVPEWFYGIVRPSYEEDMRYAARQIAARETKKSERNGPL